MSQDKNNTEQRASQEHEAEHIHEGDIPSGQGAQHGSKKDVDENRIWALLAYLGILCLIPLLGKKDSPFAQFHAKQGLVLLIGWVVSWIPLIGWIIWIGVVVLSIIGIINALSGEMKPLPLVGDAAKKLNI